MLRANPHQRHEAGQTDAERRQILGGGDCFGICRPADQNKFKTYTGPQVTQIQVYKTTERLICCMHDNIVLKSYKVDLGFAPVGAKAVRGRRKDA